MTRAARRVSFACRFALLAILGLAAVAIPLSAAAHETRTVADDYEFVVGFAEEPAIVDEVNGIWLSVATADDTPVEGLADTLQAEVTFGEETMEATLRPSFGEPGVYVSNFIPMAEGDYTFRFFGEIDGVAIDETFTSSPEGFDAVRSRSEYEFPTESAVASRELAMPVIVGGVLLLIGGLGVAVRRRAS